MRLLFVCAGNICRSAYAEAVFRRLATTRPGLDAVEVGSAGVIATPGTRPLRQAIHVAAGRGLTLTGHQARRITRQTSADLILTMDVYVQEEVEAIGLPARVELLGTYAGFEGEVVEDPYGAALETYERCADQVERLVAAAADRLERELAAPDAARA